MAGALLQPLLTATKYKRLIEKPRCKKNIVIMYLDKKKGEGIISPHLHERDIN